jgi:alpha-L-rhamnosidase
VAKLKSSTGKLYAPQMLRCEYIENPIGIDEARPRFSWVVGDTRRAAVQSAYQVIVSTSIDAIAKDKGEIWDSGRVESNRSCGVEYSGPALKSRQRCFWKVRTWDADGKSSPWSDAAFWEMGLANRSDWTASWIGMKSDTSPVPAVYVRKGFSVNKAVTRARAYVTALGAYHFHLNGERVNEDLFAPGWTDYRKRVMYRTYDVTARLAKGDNAVGAILGTGWYMGALSWSKKTNTFGDPPAKLLLQLEIEYKDGSSERVVSDGSWKCSEGPIRSSDIYAGEFYDARLEMPGWDKGGFKNSAWKNVEIFPDKGIAVNAQMDPPIKFVEELKPIAVTEPVPGTFVFDLGQNMVGLARLKVKGPAGAEVRLRHAEILNPDGAIYTANLRKAEATDKYILSGKGNEEFVPNFTYHGFRYVEVTGYPGKPARDAITGLVAHTALRPVSSFDCSSEMANKLFHNIYWGFRGNIYSVPTDCPQRDERLGWMGDAQIFGRTAAYLMDTAAFFTKWVRDISDAQSPEGAYTDVCPYPGAEILPPNGAPAWMDAGVVVPWTVYLCYGDTRVLERQFDSMCRYVDFVTANNPDGIWANKRGNDYGDWVPAGVETDKTMLATLCYFYSAHLLSEISAVLGRTAGKDKYAKIADKVRGAFNAKYLKNGRYENATQTINAMVIEMGVVPNDAFKSVSDELVKDIEGRGCHLSTGFIGTKFLLPALCDTGHDDVARRLFLNRDYPSWGYMIEQGATTIWERWNSDKMGPEMNSRNHFAFGSVGEWMFRYLAGVDIAPDASGFDRILINPRPGAPDSELSSVKALFDSIHGRIACDWKNEPDVFKLNVIIPANTSAAVRLPASSIEDVTENGKPLGRTEGVSELKFEKGVVGFTLGSGSYKLKTVKR